MVLGASSLDFNLFSQALGAIYANFVPEFLQHAVQRKEELNILRKDFFLSGK